MGWGGHVRRCCACGGAAHAPAALTAAGIFLFDSGRPRGEACERDCSAQVRTWWGRGVERRAWCDPSLQKSLGPPPARPSQPAPRAAIRGTSRAGLRFPDLSSPPAGSEAARGSAVLGGRPSLGTGSLGCRGTCSIAAGTWEEPGAVRPRAVHRKAWGLACPRGSPHNRIQLYFSVVTYFKPTA